MIVTGGFMTLLEAVNIVLRALSEHTVSSTEIRNPSVTLALDKIAIAQEEVLTDGWWFNNIRITIPREVDGRVKYPADALSFIPDGFECIVRGGYLYNAQSQTFVFEEDVPGLVTYDLEWDDLPSPVQRLIAYSAAGSAYADDMGDNLPASVQIGYANAIQQCQAIHTRQRRFNARQRQSWWRYESARRG